MYAPRHAINVVIHDECLAQNRISESNEQKIPRLADRNSHRRGVCADRNGYLHFSLHYAVYRGPIGRCQFDIHQKEPVVKSHGCSQSTLRVVAPVAKDRATPRRVASGPASDPA